MRIVNEKYETIAEYDLNKGYLAPCVIIKPDAEPLSDSKPVWADEDWEEVQVYYPYDWAKDGADIEAFRNEVIETMAKECERQIISGIEVDGHKFSLEYSDQIAMMKLLMNIQDGATSVQWHPDDEDCNTYSSQKFAEIAAKADAHVTWHQTYFNSLKKYLKAAETVDQLVEAVYGMDIPDAYQTAALQALIAKKNASGAK